MERIRKMGNRWWEYYPPFRSSTAHWHLCFDDSVSGRTEHIAHVNVTMFPPQQYAYSIDFTVEIPGCDFKSGWRNEPLETPIDDLLGRIESEYGQYLETVRDYYAALIDDFG